VIHVEGSRVFGTPGPVGEDYPATVAKRTITPINFKEIALKFVVKNVRRGSRDQHRDRLNHFCWRGLAFFFPPTFAQESSPKELMLKTGCGGDPPFFQVGKRRILSPALK